MMELLLVRLRFWPTGCNGAVPNMNEESCILVGMGVTLPTREVTASSTLIIARVDGTGLKMFRVSAAVLSN